MATQIIETFISDLSGQEIDPGSGGGSVEFTVSGTGYVVDLTEEELATFNDLLAPYVDAARRVTRRGVPVTRTTLGASAGSGRNKEQLAAIRAWARKNGLSVSDRGRIAAPILEAFDLAH